MGSQTQIRQRKEQSGGHEWPFQLSILTPWSSYLLLRGLRWLSTSSVGTLHRSLDLAGLASGPQSHSQWWFHTWNILKTARFPHQDLPVRFSSIKVHRKVWSAMSYDLKVWFHWASQCLIRWASNTDQRWFSSKHSWTVSYHILRSQCNQIWLRLLHHVFGRA